MCVVEFIRVFQGAAEFLSELCDRNRFLTTRREPKEFERQDKEKAAAKATAEKAAADAKAKHDAEVKAVADAKAAKDAKAIKDATEPHEGQGPHEHPERNGADPDPKVRGIA